MTTTPRKGKGPQGVDIPGDPTTRPIGQGVRVATLMTASDAAPCTVFTWCDDSAHDPAESAAERQVHSLPEARCEWLNAQPLYAQDGLPPYLFVDAYLSGVPLSPAGVRMLQDDLRRMVRFLDEQLERLDELEALTRR